MKTNKIVMYLLPTLFFFSAFFLAPFATADPLVPEAVPVYHLYLPTGDHLYTISETEKNDLMSKAMRNTLAVKDLEGLYSHPVVDIGVHANGMLYHREFDLGS